MKLLGNDVTLGSGLNREVDFVFDIFFMLQFATFLMAFVDEKRNNYIISNFYSLISHNQPANISANVSSVGNVLA